MNTIRPRQTGEPAPEWRSSAASSGGSRRTDAIASGGDVGVVGDSMSGKGVVVNTGELPGQDAARHPAAVRAAVRAQASRGKAKAGKSGHAARRRHQPAAGQHLTGPAGLADAGDPHVRFGGRGGASQCAVPTSIKACSPGLGTRLKSRPLAESHRAAGGVTGTRCPSRSVLRGLWAAGVRFSEKKTSLQSWR
jgi:hypothetical protein